MKLNKILIVVLVLALIGFFLIYFISPFDGGIEYEDGIEIPTEACKEISDVAFLYKAGCVPCEEMLPIVEDIEEENNLNVTYYNIIVPEQKNELSDLGLLCYIEPDRAPVLIVNCKAYFGVKSENEYKQLILGEELGQ